MIVRKLMLLALLLVFVASGKAQPNITGLATTTYSPTNDPILNWLLSFDQPVTGVTTGSFTLAGTGVSGNIASASALPGNSSWIIAVDTIAGDGTLGLNLTNPAGISGTTAPLTQTYTGEVYTVDNTSPQVASITRLDPSPTLANSVGFQITFSEAVYGVTMANFAVGGTASGSVSDISATADPAVWTGTISGISGTGLLSLDLTDTSNISDAAGNWLASDYTAGEQYQIPPQLLCISRLDGDPTSATAVRYGVQFSVPVSGFTPGNVVATGPSGAISDVTVDPNPAPAPATDWVVTVGSIAGDGTVQITLQNPATIQEGSGVSPMDLTPVNCNDNTYNIDQTAPTAGCVTLSPPGDDSRTTSATNVSFQVIFSEPVTSVTASNFTATATGLTAYSVDAPSTSDGGITWVIPVSGIAEDLSDGSNGRIELSLTNTDGIRDSAGNQPALSTGCPAVGYDIDQVGAGLTCVTREPATAADPTSATMVQFRMTFDELVQSDTVSTSDLAIVFSPAAGLSNADITSVSAVTTGPYSSEFIVTVSNIAGNNGAVPAFAYGAGSLGNGELSVTLASGATISDVSDNNVTTPVVLSSACGNTSHTIDQLPPRVISAELDNQDCLTSAIFTVEFSETIVELRPDDIDVTWTGGPCAGASTTHTVTAVTSSTYQVEVRGALAPFHVNGPGELGIFIRNDFVRDVAGNLLDAPTSSSMFYVCRCFEPAVVTEPRALTIDDAYFTTAPMGSTECLTPTDTCTTAGLQSTRGDTPTTVTAMERIAWKATEWDCATSTPFSVYIDDVLLAHTDGGTSLGALTQFPVGTTNSLCAPIGHDFMETATQRLSPGLHTVRVDTEGSCSSGTLMYFNVLDRPEWPSGTTQSEACRIPRVLNWTPVDGARGYELYFRAAPATCFTKVAETTSATVRLDTTGVTLADGTYQWFIRAFNRWGYQDSAVFTFTKTPFDTSNLHTYVTDGTVYSVESRNGVTYIGGDFTLVRVGSTYHTRRYLAAFDSRTGTLLPEITAVPNNAVYTMEFSGRDMYIGGDFTWVADGQNGNQQRARIARLTVDNDVATSVVVDLQFAPGANATVRAIAVAGDQIYYGGDFTHVGAQVYNFATPGIAASRLAVAKYDGTVSASYPANSTVYDLLRSGNQLYIAGAFTSINGQPTHALARANLTTSGTIDGTFDADIQSSVSHYIYQMAKLGNTLYVGGSFTKAGGQARLNAAAFDVAPTRETATLLPWNPAPQGAVHAVHADANSVYLGGVFTFADGARASYLLGVDHGGGNSMTCNFNVDRPVYGIDSTVHPRPQGGGTVRRVHVGGLATGVIP